MDIIEKIMEIKDVVPKKQKLLCDYIVLNHKEIGMMTAAEVAVAAGVATTTVMRFMKLLKFESYNDFKNAFLEYSLKNTMSSYGSIKENFKHIIKGEGSDPLTTTCYETIHTIENFITPKNIEEINNAIELMIKSKWINLLGLRSSRPISLYMEAAVNRFYPKVKQLSTDDSYLYDRALRIDKNEVLVVFSIWPCTRKTVKLSEICHKRKIPIILVTNTTLNPIAKFADIVIDTNSVQSPLGNLPAFVIVETLVAELAKQTISESTKNIEKLENDLDDLDLFIWESKV
ncbi:MurR/RpiR family transcriptional regulator [Fusobacterium sp. IOR10]|uniref:MurR/RpiR family transcriptional regulator n=1 Tax=Fusobacterium sp. IOR10 TaxID=2665157 RepID=UPI00210550F0|nr:MurR/RpiR family transcriptional regulator [Fusobacterium sp. IOR10]